MAENKNKIIVYRDWKNTFTELTDDEAGRLIKHFFAYINDENPEAPDRLTSLLFEPIKQTLKRDLKKYENVCERNRINGEQGGRPKQTEVNPNEPKKPSGLFTNPKNPNEPDSDSDSDSDSDINNTILNTINNAKNDFRKRAREFYDKELLTTEDSRYKVFVEYLFGANSGNIEFKRVLKIEHQLNYQQFCYLLDKCKKANIKLMDIIEQLENYEKRKYTVLFSVLKNWIARDAKMKGIKL